MHLHWSERVLRHLQEGKRAIVLEGVASDGYPMPERGIGTPPDELHPWHVVLRHHVLSADTACWTYDPATSLEFFSGANVHDLASSDDEDVHDEDDVLGMLRAEADRHDGPARDQMVVELENLLAAFDARRSVDPGTRCVLMIHDLDVAWQGAGSNEEFRRACLRVFRLAEDPSFRRDGHSLILSTRAGGELPSWFRAQGTPFAVVRAGRPTFEERAAFIVRISSNVEPRGIQIRKAKIVAAARDALRVRVSEARAELDRVQAACTEAIDIVERDENERFAEYETSLSKGEPGVLERRAGLEERLRTLRLANKGVSAEPEPLDAKTFPRLSPGDSVLYVQEGRRRPMVKRVISREGDGVVLSRTNRPAVPMTHPQDGQPVVYYWSGDGLAMRRSGESHGSPAKVPSDVRLMYVTEKAERFGAAEAELLASLAELGSAPDEAEYLALVEEARRQRDGRIRAEKERNAEIVRDAQLKLRLAQQALSRDAFPQRFQRDLDELCGNRDPNAGYPEPECGHERAARLSQGMTFRDVVSVFGSAAAEYRSCSVTDIVEMRQDILNRSYGHLFEVVQPSYGFEGIAGLEHIKEYLLHVRDNIVAGDLVKVPMGCLLMGPPGTGKSAIAEAFARECGFLFVTMKSLRSMWNGVSESQQEEALSVLRDLAPIVLYRDEVDQEDGGRDSFSGDSGVSNRMRQQMMRFLADPKIRGRIFVVNCTNRPDLMDAALKREGRTDDRLVVLMPDAETRNALIDVMFDRLRSGLGSDALVLRVSNDARERVVELTDGLAGSAMEVIVRHAVEFASVSSGVTVLDDAALLRAAEGFIPSSDSDEARKMAELALQECNRIEYLPVQYREGARLALDARRKRLSRLIAGQ